ncbi:MAG: hypothetical protein RIS76_19, partial [Verrucomicrobiota bacterium]
MGQHWVFSVAFPRMHFHTRRSLGLIVPLGLAVALQAQSPSATEVEGIRREIDQLRRDYERRMEQLEQQLKRLEQAASLPPSSAPVVEPAPAVAVITPAAFAATNAAAARAAADSRELSDALKVNEYVNSEFQLDQQTRQWSIVG